MDETAKDRAQVVATPLTDFQPYIVRKNVGGTQFNYLVGDHVAQLWYDTPRSEPISVADARQMPVHRDRSAPISWTEMEIMRDRIVMPGSRMVECGSHQGLTTVMFAAWAEGGFVRAFDAVLYNARVTRRNLELNGITNAAAYCAAIGGNRGLVNFYNESNVIVRRDAYVLASSTVMVRLDDVIEDEIDVLKLDIEGAELGVLEASPDLIRRVPRLAIEVHTDLLPPDGVPRLLHALEGRPLHVLWEDNRFEPYTGQDIATRVHLFSF